MMPVSKQSGYTLVELMIVLIMTSVLVTLIMVFTFTYWRNSYAAQADQETLTERLNANDFLREYIGSSSGIITQNGLPDSNAEVPDTAGAGPSYWLPVHAVPGNITSGSGTTKTPLMYFKRYSQNASKQLIYNGTNPYEDEYILYLDAATKSLRLRTIANPNAPSNAAKTSCPDASATANCPADRTLITGVASVDKRFFSRAGALIDWTSIYDSNINQYVGPDNPSVEVVELKINVSKKPIFQTANSTSSSTVIRIAIRNV